MSDSVCLNCGGEMEQDWAPCPKCGWKVPETWEESAEEPEEGTAASRNAILAKPRSWIEWTALFLLALGLAGLVLWMFK
jgi:uncharacterized membrane protein YvbJ